MLELLKSEFAVIQKLSLLALDRASQDGKITYCKSKESYEEERLKRMVKNVTNINKTNSHLLPQIIELKKWETTAYGV
jgi:hypothetical protein